MVGTIPCCYCKGGLLGIIEVSIKEVSICKYVYMNTHVQENNLLQHVDLIKTIANKDHGI